jgi:hypothetical protein
MEEYMKEQHHIISQHQVRADVPAITPNTIVHAYSTRKYQNLIEQFAVANDDLRVKILKELAFTFKSPIEVIYALIHSNILALLFNFTDDKFSEAIRILCLEVLSLVCEEKAGRDAVFNNKIMGQVISLTSDRVIQIRRSSLEILLSFVKEPLYRASLLELKILGLVFEHMRKEEDEAILVLLSKIHSNLLYEDGVADQSLDMDSISLLLKVVQGVSPRIVLPAIECLISMSYAERSLNALVKANVHKTMLSYFRRTSSDLDIVKMCFLLFTSLSMVIEAKQFYIDNCLIMVAFEFLRQSEPDKEVLLNTILLLTSLAEHPMGRTELKLYADKLTPFCSELLYPDLWVYTNDLMSEITWRP